MRGGRTDKHHSPSYEYWAAPVKRRGKVRERRPYERPGEIGGRGRRLPPERTPERVLPPRAAAGRTGGAQPAKAVVAKVPRVRFAPTVARRRPNTEPEIELPARKTRAQIEEEQRLRRQQQLPLNQTVARPPPAPCPCGGTVTHMPGCPYVNAASTAPANGPNVPSFIPAPVTRSSLPGSYPVQQPVQHPLPPIPELPLQQQQPVKPTGPPQVGQYQQPTPVSKDTRGSSEP